MVIFFLTHQVNRFDLHIKTKELGGNIDQRSDKKKKDEFFLAYIYEIFQNLIKKRVQFTTCTM